MSKKSKIEPVEKVKIVERYLAREIGIWHHTHVLPPIMLKR